MVVDLAKGVEERTIKLMEVCRLRNTPIMTFVNKLDRDGRDPMEVIDEIESVLSISCAPMTWPIGIGRRFIGLYRIVDDSIHLFSRTLVTRKVGPRVRLLWVWTVHGLMSFLIPMQWL